MPELPEVESIRRSLENKICGCLISDTQVLLPRQIKWPDVPGFVARTVGHRIIRLARRGKYLLFVLDDGGYLVFHLRMTGRLIYTDTGILQDAHTRIVFRLDHSAALVYSDTRTLGAIYALHADELWRIRGLSEMGPEPLTEAFSVEYLQQTLSNKKTKIKSFLLNQKSIGGLGNIYADEALFLAGIHPLRLAASLSADETGRLHGAINQVIHDGIAEGGTTFRDYCDGNGQKGRHQEHLFAYHREGKPCRRCGEIIQKIVVGGRGTHFCPHCQKI